MNQIGTSSRRIEYRHCVTFKGNQYIREEVVLPQSFRWESSPQGKLEDFHTIRWRNYDEDKYQENGCIEYYSGDKGWAKEGKLDKSNHTPEIEKVFKETIGKDLIYF